jgi:glycosyltransferase involved in cell wall biosynthesis
MVVVKADATQRNVPRNLGAYKCPKVLLVGDTHHPGVPLTSVISYALSEPFDFVILDHTRHHAHWFAKAGLRNVHWIPALDFGFLKRELRGVRTRTLTFVGNEGAWHPWCRGVLAGVQRAGLPLEVLQGTPAEAADCYADSEVTLNVSLNGELNLRVFEALGAGGFLLTDRLSDASGMERLFEPGKHLDVWGSPGELIEKIHHYLAHPEEVARIRREAYAEIILRHHPDIKTRELFDLVFSGRINPRYDLGADPLVVRSFAPARVEPRHISCLSFYEWIQEAHRSSSQMTVYCSDTRHRQLHGIVDLPRLTLLLPAEMAAAAMGNAAPADAVPSEVLWIDEAKNGLQDLISRFTGKLVVAPNTFGARLAEWGFHEFSRSDDGFGLFRLTHPVTYLRKALNAGARQTATAVLPGVLASSLSAEDCLVVAACARDLRMQEHLVSSLQRAIALDRTCQPALIQIAAIGLLQRENIFAAVALEEARRCGPLVAATDRIRIHLAESLAAELKPYLSLAGRADVERAESPLRILVVTNLFPPQELGGYGRMMWEFARALRSRGHAVRVLAGDARYLEKTPSEEESEMETHVSRALLLTGEWKTGSIHQALHAERAAAEEANAETVDREAREFEPDLVLLGNLDLLGIRLLKAVLSAGFPVLHAVANKEPGFPVAEQPHAPSYWMAPCSNWNGRVLREAGYAPARMHTLYPGARTERFYRAFPPDLRSLRVAYASIVAPYKGTHVLVEALARLHSLGVEFTAEIAGEALDADYADKLRHYCARSGIAGKVSFTGFMDRAALASLFARSNVLVFPSQFEEPFGISQVEAMASGLVVVSSGTGGAQEVVHDGQDGLLFNAGDSSALAGRLRALAADPATFQRLQASGQRRALGLSVSASVLQIENLAGQLLGTVAPKEMAEAPAA